MDGIEYQEAINRVAAFLAKDGRRTGTRNEHQPIFDGLVKSLGPFLEGFDRTFLYGMSPEEALHQSSRKKANWLANHSLFLGIAHGTKTQGKEWRILKIARDLEAVKAYEEAGIPAISMEWTESAARTIIEIIAEYEGPLASDRKPNTKTDRLEAKLEQEQRMAERLQEARDNRELQAAIHSLFNPGE